MVSLSSSQNFRGFVFQNGPKWASVYLKVLFVKIKACMGSIKNRRKQQNTHPDNKTNQYQNNPCQHCSTQLVPVHIRVNIPLKLTPFVGAERGWMLIFHFKCLAFFIAQNVTRSATSWWSNERCWRWEKFASPGSYPKISCLCTGHIPLMESIFLASL